MGAVPFHPDWQCPCGARGWAGPAGDPAKPAHCPMCGTTCGPLHPGTRLHSHWMSRRDAHAADERPHLEPIQADDGGSR